MAVPRSLILSLESIEEMSKADKHLHQLLQELGDFGRVSVTKHLVRPFRYWKKQPFPIAWLSRV
jgi:hypothetical protein